MGSVWGQSPLVLEKPKQFYNISLHTAFFEDSSARMSLADIRRADSSGRFQPSTQALINFGLRKSAIWLRFTLQNRTTEAMLIEIGEPVIDSLALYKVAGTGYAVLARSGIYESFSSRPYRTNLFLHDLQLPPGGTGTYYLRVQNSLPLVLPLRVAPLQAFFEYNHDNDILQGAYFGLMMAVAVFIFFIVVLFGSRTYFYYLLYVLFFTGFFAYHKGLSHEYLWANAVWFNRYTSVFATGTYIFAVLFVHRFLFAEYRLPITKWFKYGLLSLTVLAFGLTLTPWRVEGVGLLHAMALAINVYLLLLGIAVSILGHRLGFYFTFVWGMLVFSATVFVLQLSNLIPSNAVTRNAMQFGSATEVILLSFAIAYQINKYRTEKEEAQNEAIRQLKVNEQMRSRIARDLHDDIGSTLSSIAILSQVAQDRLAQKPDNIRQLIARISDNSLKVQDAMSDIVWTTRPDKSSFGSIAVRMQEFTAQVLGTQDVEYSFYTDSTLIDLTFSPDYQYDFYLIFKEAVNNVAKYAQAQTVHIEIVRDNGSMMLTVHDDGVGFDPQDARAKGNGLENMRRRARNLHADLHIHSSPGQGTRIRLAVPII